MQNYTNNIVYYYYCYYNYYYCYYKYYYNNYNTTTVKHLRAYLA